MKTVEINVNNFNYSDVKSWISSYTHKEKVEYLAMADGARATVIDLYAYGFKRCTKKRQFKAAKVMGLESF